MQQTITFIVDAAILEMANQRAKAENTNLNTLFRAWLDLYVAQPVASEVYRTPLAQFNHVDSGRRFDRDEMNERR